MAISASIVAYNDYDEVCEAVKSILHFTPAPDFQLFVVDNASPDGTGQRLAETEFHDPRVTVLCLPENHGFGAGHNAVLDKLHSDVHFILNPDILLTNDVLTEMADWLQTHPDAVMCTPQLFFPDGNIQHLPRRKPSPIPLVCRQFAPLQPDSFFGRINAHYTMEDVDLTVEREIQFCTGSFTAIRTEVFQKIHGFDERYFMYVEDADLTQQALRHGKAYLLPQFTAIHAWHRAPARDRKKFMMQLSSMLLFFRIWYLGIGRRKI